MDAKNWIDGKEGGQGVVPDVSRSGANVYLLVPILLDIPWRLCAPENGECI